jgi:hypothetical protein
MCNNHNRDYGKEAVYELIAIELGRTKACSARIAYLQRKEDEFEQWISDNDGDYKELKRIWMERDFINNQVVRDDGLIDIMKDRDDRVAQLEAEHDMADLLEKQMYDNVRKAYNKQYGLEGNLRFWEEKLDKCSERIERLKQELTTQDTIQDYIDKYATNPIRPESVRALGLGKARLQDRMQQGTIEYETFSMFFNQINEVLESIDGITRSRVKMSEFPVVPDRITYFETKLAGIKVKVEEAHRAMFKEVEPKEEDTFQDIVAQGFELATNEKEFNQVLEFIKDNR